MHKMILSALCGLLLSGQALAANCVTIVSYDRVLRTLTPITVDWSDVLLLKREALFPVTSIFVFYDQFGIQGGPSVISGWAKFGLVHFPADGRIAQEALTVSYWWNAPEQGIRARFTGAANAASDVELIEAEEASGFEATVLDDVDFNVNGETAAATVASGDALAGRVRDGIVARGTCR